MTNTTAAGTPGPAATATAAPTRLFGTDGVRGIAHQQLTTGMAYTLGHLAATLLGPRLIIGRDTRTSGPALQDALAAGIAAAGGTPLLAGIIPTPAVALLARQLQTHGGVVISASHNPPAYNGIKFFDAQGFKLTKQLEDQFEQGLQQYMASSYNDKPGSPAAGETSPSSPTPGACVEEATELYLSHNVETVSKQGLDLIGMKIAVDTGFGASGVSTPQALERLGAQVVAINTDFDGDRINVDCGSTHLGPLKQLVAQSGAHLGIAHDGDADRMLAVDAQGNEVDGDVIEAIIALDLKARGALAHNTVVTTVLCNLGFVRAMEAHDVRVVQTAVGDSNVLAAMRQGGFVIGGEQSGHMILLEHNNTGDGLLTALQLCAVVKRSGKSLAELAKVVTRFPQVMINVKVSDREAFASSEVIAQAGRDAQQRLGDAGRVLLRASGTEALVRVMVEAQDLAIAQKEATQLSAVVEQELGSR